jgi:hypothetical protein
MDKIINLFNLLIIALVNIFFFDSPLVKLLRLLYTNVLIISPRQRLWSEVALKKNSENPVK